MSLLDQIEKKFGFKLPPSYRVLAEAGTFDEEFQLADGYIMTPQDLADFEWEDFMNPIPGLVPFAYNGAGEPYCWLTQETAVDGELPIIAAMDGGEGYWFAPTVTGTIFRDAFIWYDMQANQEAPEEIYDELPALLKVLDAYAPKPWPDTLRAMKGLPTRENEFGNPCLYTEKESEDLFYKLFGEQYADNSIEWETAE